MNSLLENRPLVTGRSAGFATAPKPETAFRPLFSPAAKPAQAGGAGAEGEQDEPKVEFVQNGGKVERIIVTCTCCKRIELKCEY
jgi:hypothetical protein